MPDVLYVGLQDDDKIVSFGIDAGAGKLVPSGDDAGRRRAVSLRGQPGPARPVCRLSRYAGHRELSHRLVQRRADVAGARRDRASRRPISPPTAPANTSCRPTTRAGTRPCIRSEATVR